MMFGRLCSESGAETEQAAVKISAKTEPIRARDCKALVYQRDSPARQTDVIVYVPNMEGIFKPRELPRPGRAFCPEDQIEVWSVDLNISDDALADLRLTLSNDETARSNRFHFERHRRRFVAARASLRAVLAAYVDLDPSHIEFEYGQKGKPRLAGEAVNSGLHFNVSHSNERALIAVSRAPLGVDIEHIRPLKDCEAIARRFFSEAEQCSLVSVPTERKLEAFFTCWTRKEAYIKAVGDGLSIPLDSFDVTFLTEQKPSLTVRSEARQGERWFLNHLAGGPDYIGALAVRDHDPRVATWRLASNPIQR